MTQRLPVALLLTFFAFSLAGCDLLGPPDPPSSPSALSANATTVSTIELTWSEDAEATEEIEIERREEATTEFRTVSTITGGNERYQDTGLVPETAYRYRVRACNEGGCSGFSTPANGETLALLGVETTELPAAIEGEPYRARLQARGGDGDYTWTLSEGAVPDGLSLSEDGTVSGTPAETGNVTFTPEVASGDGQTATVDLSLAIVLPLEIETESLPSAVVGSPYTAELSASGGDEDYAWGLTEGSLPGGLSLSRDGVISGTPEMEETATFTARVTSGDDQSAEAGLSLTVASSGELSVATPVLPPGVNGGPYDVGLEANGGDGSYEWSLVAGSLPSGLSLDPSGRIHGTASAVEVSTFTVQVVSGDHSATADFEIEIVANDTGAYNLTSFDVAQISSGLEDHLDQAFARWEEIVVGDLGAVAIPTDYFQSGDCGGFGELVNGTSVDDLLVIVNVTSIDGAGGILARAGPCALRNDTLPPVGRISLDREDAEALLGTETLTDVIIHELGHALGFGTLWGFHGFVTGSGTSDPRYTGSEAVARYQDLGGSGDVPLENDGGQGTVESHWEKDDFNEELMTGFAEPEGVEQPFSEVSVGAMQDLGYAVDFNAADPFTLSALVASWMEGSDLGHDMVFDEPIRFLPQSAHLSNAGGSR